MTSAPDPVPLASQAETTGIIVVSLFPTRAKVEAAVRDLKRAGFTDQEIGVVMQDPGKPDLHPDAAESTSHAATVGAVRGSLLGGLEVCWPQLLPGPASVPQPADSRRF